MIADLIAILLFLYHHLLSIESLTLYLTYLPLLIIGLFLGRLVRTKMDEKRFNNSILILLILLAGKLIINYLKTILM